MVCARAAQTLGFDWVVCLSCHEVGVVIELLVIGFDLGVHKYEGTEEGEHRKV
jgi:hypothetical protein